MRQKVTNKSLLKSSARPPARLTRVYDDDDLDAPSCKLRDAAVLNVDRWRHYTSQQVYEALSKYFLSMPSTSAMSAAYEVREFVHDDLPDLVDHLFTLPTSTPQPSRGQQATACSSQVGSLAQGV
eukprot:PhM_4_TR9480/c3_g1_i1/m.82664